MLSIRSFMRSASRNVLRSSTHSCSRPLSTVSRPSFLHSSWKPALRPRYPAFSTSLSRYAPAGETDVELAAKIGSELALENESRDISQLPPPIKDFLDNSDWQLKDTAGNEEVVLTKKFGDEDIKISFSIDDLNTADDADADDMEDAALDDEMDQEEASSLQSSGGRSKGNINQGQAGDRNFRVAPEDELAPVDRDEESGAPPVPAFATRVNVTIKKPGKGAVQLECVATDGYMEIENVYHFRSSDLADVSTAEKDFTRQNVYAGPPFTNLDEDLQLMFERYIQERGINETLAQFIPDYIEFKEQKEYVQWLDGVKSFVEA